MLTAREFLERDGSSPFAKWFGGLDAPAGAKITAAVRRLELGNISNVKGVILLRGGTKKTRDRDIATAHARWQDYKKRKAEEK
jgi:putative component of toxin-antitoxin plasmid stabilization module